MLINFFCAQVRLPLRPKLFSSEWQLTCTGYQVDAYSYLSCRSALTTITDLAGKAISLSKLNGIDQALPLVERREAFAMRPVPLLVV